MNILLGIVVLVGGLGAAGGILAGLWKFTGWHAHGSYPGWIFALALPWMVLLTLLAIGIGVFAVVGGIGSMVGAFS